MQWNAGAVMAAAAVALVLSGCADGDSSASNGEGRPAEARAAAPEAEAPEPNPSSWLLVREGSGSEAGPAIELVREASRGGNSIGIPPTLHLRCEGDATTVTVVWYEDPEGSDNDVTTTIDSETPVRRNWSNVNEDASYFPPDSAVYFVQRLMAADTLVVESNLYKRVPIEAAFALDGLSEEIAPVREACGW